MVSCIFSCIERGGGGVYRKAMVRVPLDGGHRFREG